jgi:hypothetical protein
MIANDGSLQIEADTYLFVPASEIKPISSGADITYYGTGAISLFYSTTGEKEVLFGMEMPAVLYGQPVRIEEVSIFYNVSNSASYITRTIVAKQLLGYEIEILIDDNTDRNSTSYGSYSVTPPSWVNPWLSSQIGFVGVTLRIKISDTSHYINIGGVRVRLGHHPLD